jgi:xanthosine phosphorylase
MKTHPAYHAAKILQEIVPNFKPKLGIILGSGLGKITELIEDTKTIPYVDIPGFPTCSIEGHEELLHFGYLKGTPIVCLQGRPHFYEGYAHFNEEASTRTLTTPIRTLKLLGCDDLLTANASGSLRQELPPGTLVAISDHINFQFTNPLLGPNDHGFGPRFVSMDEVYNADLRQLLQQAATRLNLNLPEGIYIGVLGPSFETPAEIRMFQQWGADAIGMSAVPEAIIARHCGLNFATVAVITNFAAGLSKEKISHELTLRGAKQGVDQLAKLVLAFAEEYGKT